MTQARGLNVLHPSSPQQHVLWPLPTMLGPPAVKSSRHPSGSEPRGTCQPLLWGFFSSLAKSRHRGKQNKFSKPCSFLESPV